MDESVHSSKRVYRKREAPMAAPRLMDSRSSASLAVRPTPWAFSAGSMAGHGPPAEVLTRAPVRRSRLCAPALGGARG